MCVIFFYANSEPTVNGYKLILASNRDEFFARDTQTAGEWSNGGHVYGGEYSVIERQRHHIQWNISNVVGIDLEPGREGGTWLAIGNGKGIFKVGALLNLTGEPKPRNAVGKNNTQHTHTSTCIRTHSKFNH